MNVSPGLSFLLVASIKDGLPALTWLSHGFFASSFQCSNDQYSVALGAGVGLLVGGLFPGMAGCRAGVTLVTVVCLLVCGSGSWVLWLQGPGGVQELVFWPMGGWGWVQGILGLVPTH